MNPLQEITVDKLFRARKDVTLLGKVFWVRALTDLERNLRYKSAALARSRLAQKLDDKTSDEYLINFGVFDSLTDDELREVVLVFHNREAIREAQKEYPYQLVPIPDDPTEAEVDAVHKERLQKKLEMDASQEKFVKDYLGRERKRLEGLSHEALASEYKKSVRESVLIATFAEEIDTQTLYLCMDNQLTLEEVRGLGAQARRKLLEAYMEVDNIDPLLLKSPALTETLLAP